MTRLLLTLVRYFFPPPRWTPIRGFDVPPDVEWGKPDVEWSGLECVTTTYSRCGRFKQVCRQFRRHGTQIYRAVP